MVWDIVIASAAGLCQLITALLGWRVAVNPLDPNNPQHRKRRLWFNALFIVVGLLGVALVGLGAYRMPRDHAHLAYRMRPLYYQGPINRADIVNWASGPDGHRAEFLEINQPVGFNVVYTNVGSGVAVNSRCYKAAFVEPDISPSSQADALAQFEKMKAVEPGFATGTLTKGESGFVSAKGPILSPEDYNNLVFGRRVLYVVVETAYNDDSGQHTRQMCRALQPPQPGGVLIWANCDNFNDEK